MQSILWLNLQPLILILVFCISSVFLCYTDLDSSRLLLSVTVSDLTNLRISELLYTTVLYSVRTCRIQPLGNFQTKEGGSEKQLQNAQKTRVELKNKFDNSHCSKEQGDDDSQHGNSQGPKDMELKKKPKTLISPFLCWVSDQCLMRSLS